MDDIKQKSAKKNWLKYIVGQFTNNPQRSLFQCGNCLQFILINEKTEYKLKT